MARVTPTTLTKQLSGFYFARNDAGRHTRVTRKTRSTRADGSEVVTVTLEDGSKLRLTVQVA